MAKPIIDVNQPQDSDIIGQGAEAIRETRQQIYDLFPIGPDDLDYNDTSNWWPAGSLTGGFDPDVESGSAEPHPDMQDRYALVGQQVAVWDWQMPDNKNILTIGLDTGTATVTEGTNTNWVNIETDDKVQPMRLHDLMDVYLGTVEPEDDDVLIYNDAQSQWVNRPRSSLAADGAPGADGKGWTGTTVLQDDAETYIIRFDSAYPELVFDTVNLKGPAGDDGISAYEEWLAAGNSGTEQDFLDSLQGANGADGADGDSAYEIALDNGFQGTEEEWLESLVGDEGPAGADGHGLNFQGEVADEASLPPTANEGDTYKTTDTGHLWVYTENGDWLDLGNVEGAPGADGASAYEVAVANGFIGTEAQWLDSLVGEDGVTPTIVAGTATKLDHQAAPTVTLSVIGNDTYQYDFGIPAGEPADPLDLEPLENAVSDLQTDLSNLEGRVGQNESDISDIQSEQITQNDAIQANQDKNNEQDGRLDNLDTAVSDNASAIEVNANAIADIQNIQGGANTVPDPVKADDVLMSDGPDAYSWRTIDLAAIEDVRDKVYDHENQIHGNPDTLPDPTVGLIERVDELEGRVDSIAGTDPDDHVTQDQLNTALYGTGSSPGTAEGDGVYVAIQENTDLIEENSQAIDGINTQLTPNEDGYILTGVVTDNGDGSFTKSTAWLPNEHIDDELPPTDEASEGDILALVDNGGTLEPEWIVQPEAMDLGSTEPWTHGQYNELEVVEGAMTEAVIDLHVTPMVHLKPDAGSTVQVRATLPQRPSPDDPAILLPIEGMTANIVLSMGDPAEGGLRNTYDFSDPIWNIGTQTYTDLDNDMILSFLSEGKEGQDQRWHCVGMSYVGADAVVEAGESYDDTEVRALIDTKITEEDLEPIYLDRANGMVGIGTDSPTHSLHVNGSLPLNLNSTIGNQNKIVFKDNGVTRGHIGAGANDMFSIGDAAGHIRFGFESGSLFRIYNNANQNLSSGIYNGGGLIFKDENSNPFYFRTGGDEVMRIIPTGAKVGADSNVSNGGAERLTVDAGTTGGHAGVFSTNTSGGFCGLWVNLGDNAGNFAHFNKNKTVIGSITTNDGTTVQYNTTSDYRLKENITPMSGAVDRLKQLKPSHWTWKQNGVNGEGFIAHEVQTVVPMAISGEKDAIKTEEYEITPAVRGVNGEEETPAVMGTREVPEYQGIDHSKLVPLLTSALQEAITRIETLEAQVAQLGG